MSKKITSYVAIYVNIVCCLCNRQWSFGVTLWELFTSGSQPYVDIDPFEMARYLQDGYRVSQPLNCPNDLLVFL